MKELWLSTEIFIGVKATLNVGNKSAHILHRANYNRVLFLIRKDVKDEKQWLESYLHKKLRQNGGQLWTEKRSWNCSTKDRGLDP